MSILDDLARRTGTVAVGRFTLEGKLVEYQSGENLPEEAAAAASQFAATIVMLMGTFGATFSELTRLPMVPFYGWLYSGGEMSSMIQGDRWALMRTEQSQFRVKAGEDDPQLGSLLEQPGVRFAAYYAPDGNEIAHAQTIGFARELHRNVTEIVASGTATFRGLGAAFSHLTKTPWAPPKVWIYSGGDWIVAASGSCWVLGEAGEADVLALHGALAR